MQQRLNPLSLFIINCYLFNEFPSSREIQNIYALFGELNHIHLHWFRGELKQTKGSL